MNPTDPQAPHAQALATPQSLLDRIAEEQERNRADIASRYQPTLTVKQFSEREKLLRELKEMLVEGVDYGVIPGTDKPTLLLPGAQKICTFFGYVPHYEVRQIEDWTGAEHGGEPLFYYDYTCTLLKDGKPVGEGRGSCSSWESKYRYRWVTEDVARKMDAAGGQGFFSLVSRGGRISEPAFAIEKAETTGKYGKPPEYWNKFREAITNGTATQAKKPKKDGGQMDAWEIDSTVYRVPNENIFDIVNTCQKIGQKRSYVGSTLSATGASQYFTQDLEDGDLAEQVTGHAVRPAPETQAQVAERRIAEERAKVAPERPVPAELQQMFADLAKPGALAAAAEQIQDWLIEVGGREGDTVYKNVFGTLRARFPKGSVIPIQDLKLCFLELWDELVAFRAKPKPDVEKSKSGGSQQDTERGAAAEVPGSPSTSAGGTGTTKKPTSKLYKVLGKFRDRKADLFKVFESDDCYYRILKRNGFEQSNEIMDEAVGMAILADMKNAFDDRMLIIEQRGTHVETAPEVTQYQPADSDVPF